MSIYSRRTVVLNGLLTVIIGNCCNAASAQAQSQGGCWVPTSRVQAYFASSNEAYAYQNGNEHIEPRSGNSSLDHALVQSLARLSNLLEVLPGFAYYDDSSAPNAKATSAQLLDRTDGTVLFGLSLLQECLARPSNGDASIVAICAHEYGHILSYKNDMIGTLSPSGSGDQGVFRSEQFADYIAGYYAGVRKRENPAYPAVAFATTQRSFGGGDHGSGRQRGEAVEAGFLAAYQRNLAPQVAFQNGLQFCMQREIEY